MSVEQIQELPLDRIEANPQVREHFDETALGGLAVSLQEVGQLQPIRVRKAGNKYIVVEGERRLRAARKAERKTIAAIVEGKDLCEAEILHRQLVSACQTEQLSALERAKAIDRLMTVAEWTAAEAAARLGLSPPTVAKYLAILKLPLAIQDRVRDGKIPASAAYELAQIDDPAQQSLLAQQMTEGRLTRDGLAGARRANRTTANPSNGQAEAARATALLGEGRTVTVVAKGLNLELFIECLTTLVSEAKKVRARGVELSTFLKILKDQSR